jgi:hypothetical protein
MALVAAAVRPAFGADGSAPAPIYTLKDAATGAAIRIYQEGASRYRLEVSDDRVTVVRVLDRTATVTSAATLTDRTTVTTDRHAMRVDPLGRSEVMTPGLPAQIAEARTLVQGSDAVGRALDLLGRMSVPVESPLGQQLLAARAVLLSAAGDGGRVRETLALGRAAFSAPRVEAGSATDDELTPTECWNAYVAEALAALDEYEDCFNDCAWYNVICTVGCAAIYDLRAMGAFAWWLRCVGLGVSG